MSVDKWAYEPSKCDGNPCCGDCNLCPLEKGYRPMELWVKELPATCDDCDLHDDTVWCCLTGETVIYNSDRRDSRCPLKLLREYKPMKAIDMIKDETKKVVIKLTELQDELAIKQERSMFE